MIDAMQANPNADDPSLRGPRFASSIRAFQAPGFAVVDGGLFDDLPTLLREQDLFGRSLFVDHADVEVEKAGPWLIALDQHADGLERVLDIVGSKPAAVYWACASGDMVLYRHLRTINMVLLPVWAARGQSVPPDLRNGDEPDTFEAVLFRHWDPRVLGALLPILNADQFARLVGPAAELAFVAEDFGGIRRVLADDAWPRSASGLLKISADQVLGLAERREGAHRQRVADFLLGVASDVLASAERPTLRRTVRDALHSGRALGLTSEQAHCRWAYMMLMSDGRIAHNRDARAYLTEGPESPNERVGLMMRGVVEALRGVGRGTIR